MCDRMDARWANRAVYYAANKSATDGPIDGTNAAAPGDLISERMSDRVGLAITQVGETQKFQGPTK